MSCSRCASDKLKDFNAELAIHFPGWEGLEKALVWAFPKLNVCLACGFTEFMLPEEQVEELKNGGFPPQPRGDHSATKRQ